ncbi:MAG: hypothetical protein NT079_02100, partial [Candidatus Omnitrophica bacterium]|nr:hypothetical protein [Candidatus Omnitrophota bacterium]
YAVLYGEDIFQNLCIDLKNLRHQCEGELKSKIIRMRQFFIRNSNDAGAIKRFLLKIAPSITVVLKNILRLKNINIRPTESLAQKIVAELGLSTNALAIMLEMRAKGLCSKSAKALLEDVLLELQQISSVLDKM